MVHKQQYRFAIRYRKLLRQPLLTLRAKLATVGAGSLCVETQQNRIGSIDTVLNKVRHAVDRQLEGRSQQGAIIMIAHQRIKWAGEC